MITKQVALEVVAVVIVVVVVVLAVEVEVHVILVRPTTVRTDGCHYKIPYQVQV
jgi:hypothetical protein